MAFSLVEVLPSTPASQGDTVRGEGDVAVYMVSTTRVGLYGKRDLTRENDSGSNDRYLPPRPPGRGVRTVYHNPIVLKNTPLVLSG